MDDLLASIRRIIAEDLGDASMVSGPADAMVDSPQLAATRTRARAPRAPGADPSLGVSRPALSPRSMPAARHRSPGTTQSESRGNSLQAAAAVNIQPVPELLEEDEAVPRTSAATGSPPATADVAQEGEPLAAPRGAPGRNACVDDDTVELSAPTVASLAASIETLSSAFETNRRQSVDELVRELMQPLVREWLDVHLPGIVEREVQCAIERYCLAPKVGNRRP